ncbi:MAG: hypothetical protein RIA63_11920 [Cyclobacteriaceae bacterium]
MKAVKVQYTVKHDFVETNKANISKVMAKLKVEPISGMQYASFILDDGQTFVHINMAKDQDTLSRLSEVMEFKEFQAALKASGPVSPPKADNLNLVAAGFELIG